MYCESFPEKFQEDISFGNGADLREEETPGKPQIGKNGRRYGPERFLGGRNSRKKIHESGSKAMNPTTEKKSTGVRKSSGRPLSVFPIGVNRGFSEDDRKRIVRLAERRGRMRPNTG